MLIYIFVFIISSLLLLLSEKMNNKVLRRTLIVVAIVIPSLLAGMRASSIGTDVKVYGKGFYLLAAKFDSMVQLMKYLTITGLSSDIGFHILNFVLTRLFPSYHVGLFVYEALTLTFFYLGLARIKKHNNIPIYWQMLVLYFTIYNLSLNIMRQMIAVSLVFFAFSYLIERKYKSYILLSIIASFIHSSAIISFAILVIFIILNDERNEKRKIKIFQTAFLFVIIFVILLSLKYIVSILVQYGIVRQNYLNYFPGGKLSAKGSLSIFDLMIPVTFLAINILFYKRNTKLIKNNDVYFSISILNLLISTTIVFSPYFGRIGYYFVPIFIHYQFLNGFNFKKNSRIIWYLFILSMYVLIWFFTIIVFNYGETVPYLFYFN